LYEYNLTGILYYNGTLSQRVKDLSTNKIQFINLPFNNMTIDIIENIETPLLKRDYQIEAYNKLLNKPTSILSLPCGMGKTYTASLLSKNYDNIIILSPTRYLSFQTLEHFKKYGYCILKNVFNEEIGLKCQQRLWEEMKQYDQNDQSTWIDKKFQLSKIYYDEKPFDDIFNERL
jgi:superfamily II DNA or RNA helicase